MAIEVEYYSDVLCVWAWIAQRRLDEMRQDFGDDVQLRTRYVNVFGNTRVKIGAGWSDRGGYEGFGRHVVASAAPFPDAPVAADIWQQVRPSSSAPAHTILKATELSHDAATAERFAVHIREQFFTANADIAALNTLLALAASLDLNVAAIQDVLQSGTALAELMADYQSAQQQGIKGSPSWVLDNGRQILYGNVGYRVLRANAAELLKQLPNEASWC